MSEHSQKEPVTKKQSARIDELVSLVKETGGRVSTLYILTETDFHPNIVRLAVQAGKLKYEAKASDNLQWLYIPDSN